jgi:hypothetical protein
MKLKEQPIIVEKRAFDSALGKLLRADPLPLSEIPKRRKPAKRKPRKTTR